MNKRDVDTMCSIAERLLQDAVTLREIGCERAARLLEQAERELDAHVYGGGCQGRDSGETGSPTHH
jgi:hypothetical protein